MRKVRDILAILGLAAATVLAAPPVRAQAPAPTPDPAPTPAPTPDPQGDAASGRVAAPAATPVLGDAASSRVVPASDRAVDVKTLEEAAARFAEDGLSYRMDVMALLKREIARRTQNIEQTYDHEAARLDDQIRERRREALAVFERFLERYPSNARYTPEVLFRLGKLYFDEAQDAYQQALPEYDRQRRLYDRGKVAEEPGEPTRDLSKAIATYQDLLQRFPSFRSADETWYALGFSQKLSGEDDRAVTAFRNLIERHPKSRLVPDAWLLVGEHWFDLGRYAESVEAYRNALASKDARYYGITLYKLAWSYFQMYDYPTAIRTFKDLIEYIDGQKDRNERSRQLRTESVEYLGLSLADDDWNGDGENDPDANVQRALSYLSDNKPYEREILERYADALYSEFEIRKFPMAVEAFRAVIARDPMNPGNAAVKEKIINTFDTLRDTEKSIAERQDMVRQFGPGSAWYEHNRNHPEVLARVDRRIELALNQAAQFHHKRAQELKAQAGRTGDEQYRVASLSEYKAAAEAYRDYLRRFPDSRYAYENTYYFADALYYSFEFERAAEQYRRIRDWPAKDRFVEQAAFNVIDSLEREAAKRVKDGRLAAADVPGEVTQVADEKMPVAEGKVRVAPLEIPPLTRQWILDVDHYLGRGLTREGDADLVPRLAYRVAAELYKRRHLDDARKRFEDLLAKYPQSGVASYSAASIINSYRIENDWENIGIWARKLEDLKVGKVEEREALAREVKVFQLGAEFKQAEALFEKKDWVAAAESFQRIVTSDPRNKLADKALQNAAVAYQNAFHYDSAARVYQRIIDEYPQSPFVEGALLQLAENARKFFDFDRAISTYQALQVRFPRSEQAPYAMYTAARLLDAEGRTAEAIRAYEKFAATFPGDVEAGPVLFQAGLLHEKLGNREDALRLYKKFVGQYGAAAALSGKVVEALSRSGDLVRGQGNTREWERFTRAVVQEFDARGLQAETPAATFAARAVFQLIEEKFKAYEAIRFTGALAAQKKNLVEKARLLEELEGEYKRVLPYKAMEWTFAAYYRLAQIHELFARSLFQAQIPKMSEEEMDIYQTAIEDKAKVYQDTARQRYATVVQQGRTLKIANEWTRKALEALNQYLPQEYPLQKEERRAWDIDPKPSVTFEESL